MTSTTHAEVSRTIDMDARIHLELTRTYIVRARHAALCAPAGSLFLAASMLDRIRPTMILLWLAMVLIPDIITIIRSFGFEHSPHSPRDIRNWHYTQMLLHLATGLAWGASIPLFIDATSLGGDEYRILCILIAVTALSITVTAPFLSAVLLFTLAVWLLPMVHFVTAPDTNLTWIITGVILLIAATNYFGQIAHRNLRRQLHDYVLHRGLAHELADAKWRLEANNVQLEEQNDKIATALQEVNRLATHDELTGLYNRRYILERIKVEQQQHIRYGNPCSLMLLDIDHFKIINDRYGHALGDEVLKALSRRIESTLREGDTFSRYGGEEFIILLPMTDIKAAMVLAERVRTAIAQEPLIKSPTLLEVRCSVGVAELAAYEAMESWIARADQALYRAKKEGRDSVVAAAPLG